MEVTTMDKDDVKERMAEVPNVEEAGVEEADVEV